MSGVRTWVQRVRRRGMDNLRLFEDTPAAGPDWLDGEAERAEKLRDGGQRSTIPRRARHRPDP